MAGGERRAVVKAIADHQWPRATGRQGGDGGKLVLWRQPGAGVESKRARHGIDGARPVTRQDRPRQAKVGKRGNGGGGIGTQRIGKADDRRAGAADLQRGGERFAIIIAAAKADRLALPLAGDTCAWHFGDIGDIGGANAFGHQCPAQRRA